jgi:hypothetical protein
MIPLALTPADGMYPMEWTGGTAEPSVHKGYSGTPALFLIPRISGSTRRNYRRTMTTAGAIVTAVTLPVLIGQVLYAVSRGRPSARRRT